MLASRMTRAGVTLALVLIVAACSPDPRIMHIERGQVTPDEFSILPSKPIEIPTDLSTLPPPTPGAANRTDATPREDAVAALGGDPSRLRTDGRLSDDGALIRQTTRYGVDPNIRNDLAVADAEFRRKNKGRLLERWFRVPTYYDAYSASELNQHSTLDAYRRAGVPTPAAPPIVAAE
ncbi:DUF3035 domain-containing protein [Tropicimonas sediminicola]|uniref:Beta-barrel assembly machine subunit BamF n=1 Tax=Tropicimonas sediminicola TaxID=1031541 RepID=A0A239IND8_9RHOB|nr:DUF3035 domain-containing protein [Tropicimonas sediminicola]SNS93924.1 Beta-barrel assembly machine subunit BamF [Tropicimonas sediminicola]